MTEDRGQKTEVRERMTDDRNSEFFYMLYALCPLLYAFFPVTRNPNT